MGACLLPCSGLRSIPQYALCTAHSFLPPRMATRCFCLSVMAGLRVFVGTSDSVLVFPSETWLMFDAPPMRVNPRFKPWRFRPAPVCTDAGFSRQVLSMDFSLPCDFLCNTFFPLADGSATVTHRAHNPYNREHPCSSPAYVIIIPARGEVFWGVSQ